MRSKTALITGASGNIGKAITETLLRNGCRLYLYVGHRETREELVEWLSLTFPSPNLWHVFIEDMSDNDEEKAIYHDRQMGPPTSLVFAHGIGGKYDTFRMHLDDFRHIIETNVVSCLTYARHYSTYMKKAGFGRIVFISSIHAQQTYPERAAYAASKGGLEALARVLALEWGPHSITTNCIAPGQLDVPMKGSPIDADFLETVRKRTPTLKLTTAAQVASLTAWLLSDAAAQVNGQVIRMDGGLGISAWPHEFSQ